MEHLINIAGQLLPGLGILLEVFALTVAIGIPLGMCICLLRMSKIRPLKWLSQIYILIFRGTPLMLQLIFFFLAWPIIFGKGAAMERTFAAIVAFALNYAAYFAEIFRGGIQSVPRGQYEAAQVLGLSHRQCFFKIVVPQVVKRVIPPMGNEFVTLVKDTALVYAIAINDITRIAKTIMMNENDMLAFIVAGIFYLILTTLVTFAFNAIEKKLDYYKI